MSNKLVVGRCHVIELQQIGSNLCTAFTLASTKIHLPSLVEFVQSLALCVSSLQALLVTATVLDL